MVEDSAAKILGLSQTGIGMAEMAYPDDRALLCEISGLGLYVEMSDVGGCACLLIATIPL